MKLLAENPTCKESLIVQQEGTRQEERLQKQAVSSILEHTAVFDFNLLKITGGERQSKHIKIPNDLGEVKRW